MNEQKRYSIKKIFFASLWLIVGTGIVILLFAAVRKRDAAKCKDIQIKISGIEKANEAKFVDEKDILNTIQSTCKDNPVGSSLSSINLKEIENKLKKSKWVRNVQLFFDNNEVLKVSIDERTPIARVFTNSGNSFYIDTALAMLPLSNKVSARVPVFTGFPTDNIVLSKADSNLLTDIKNISLTLQKDSFRSAMIDQIDITSERNFEMVPKIGHHVIQFGNANHAEEKFNKLVLFYKTVILKSGWNKYSSVNLQYKNQVIAKRWDAEDKTADSVRTLQIMREIAANAARLAADTVSTFSQDDNDNTPDGSMVQESIQRDDNNSPVEEPSNSTQINQVTKPVVLAAPIIAKPTVAKKPVVTAKPAAVSKPKVVSKPIAVKPAAPKKNNNLPIKKVISKPIQKQNNTAPKQNTIKKTTKKPKAVMPPKNDYGPNP